MRRHQLPLRLLGLLLVYFSATMIPPIGVSLLYHDGEALHYVNSLLLILGLGITCWRLGREATGVVNTSDGFLIVGLFWVVLSLLSAIPFIFSPHLSFVDALFESVSGFTTTGATVIIGLDDLPESILYYRAQLQWLGGMGIIVLAVAVLPMLGVGGMQLYRAETPGPMKDDKLTPRIKHTAANMWSIYSVLTVLCIVAYRLAGMSWFDAVAHAFTTISTGGFSTHDASISYFDNLSIELVAIVFMALGAINFAVHFRTFQSRDWSLYVRDEEVRAFLLVVAVVSSAVAGMLIFTSTYPEVVQSVRVVVFQTVSILTSTGFTTVNFSLWPLFTPVMLIFLSFIGGCAGSTAGGMKVIRWLLIYKQGAQEVAMLVHPRGLFAIKLNGQPVSQRAITAVWGFFSVYILTFAILTMLMMWTGLDQVSAFSAVATCINNLGPGLGAVSVNFVNVNSWGVAVSIVAMLLGRLEIFTLLVLISPMFWRR